MTTDPPVRGLPVPFTADAYRRRTRDGVDGDECALCGRHTGSKRRRVLHVRLDAGLGQVIPLDDPAEQDGGWFPVGPECAKQFPAGYLLRLDPQDA